MQQSVEFEFQWWRDTKGYKLVDTPRPNPEEAAELASIATLGGSAERAALDWESPVWPCVGGPEAATDRDTSTEPGVAG